jgi:GTP-binding protein EngB required for normal cell division
MSHHERQRSKSYVRSRDPAYVEKVSYTRSERSSPSETRFAPKYSLSLDGRRDRTVSRSYHASPPSASPPPPPQYTARPSRITSSPENLPFRSNPSYPPPSHSITRYNYGSRKDPLKCASVSSYQQPVFQEITRHTGANGMREDLNFLVLGQTSAGKSSFINLLIHRGDLRAGAPRTAEVGHSLRSCTSNVNEYSCAADDGRRFNLIDTPGFDDTTRSDAEVLTTIATYLALQYRSGRRIHGIIFLHRIVDVRLCASAIKMAETVKRMCGEEFYGYVALVTNMWQLLKDQETGNQRERELLTHPKFWGDFRAYSPTFQHRNTRENASKIMESFLDRLETSRKGPPLRIQAEIVDEGQPISKTDAGNFLEGQLARMRDKHEQELRRIKHEIRIATQGSDPEIAEALSESYGSTRLQLQQTDRDIQMLKKEVDFFREENPSSPRRHSISRYWTEPSSHSRRRHVNFETPSSAGSDSDSDTRGHKYDTENMPMIPTDRFSHFEEPGSYLGQQKDTSIIDSILPSSTTSKEAPNPRSERKVIIGTESGAGKPRKTKASTSFGAFGEWMLGPPIPRRQPSSQPASRRQSMIASNPLKRDEVRLCSAHP